MQVEVKLFATLQKDRFQKAMVYLDQGSKVSDLLNHLGITVDDVGVLVVNKRDATFDQSLNEGDTITIIPPIGGG
jgi:sulfur carrier protein